LWRRDPAVDLVRVQDVGLAHAEDADILNWAAAHERILITRDVSTMVASAWRRVAAGQAMPGVLALRSDVHVGKAIEDLLLVVHCATADEMKNQVKYIPL
jgi:predicted nuclease of predicted toxin-antitoxin system